MSEPLQLQDKASSLIETTAALEEAVGVLERRRRELDRQIQETQLNANKVLNNALTTIGLKGIDEELLRQFAKRPYLVMPRDEHSWFLIVPRFLPMQVGWLDRTDAGWNIFVIDRYSEWLGSVPDEVKKLIGIEEEKLEATVDGPFLKIAVDQMEKVWSRYQQHLLRREQPGIFRIASGHEFTLIETLVKDGILPFKKNPVAMEDLRSQDPQRQPYADAEMFPDFQEKPEQADTYQKFLQTGALGVFWPPGFGKMFLGLKLLARLKGSKLIVAPTLMLIQEWQRKIKAYLSWEAQREITVTTYVSAPKYLNQQFTLCIFDEAQSLPANTYIKMSTLRAKYRVGLSASPYREDGRQELIFALTGYPCLTGSTLVKTPSDSWVPLSHYHLTKTVAMDNDLQLVERSATLIPTELGRRRLLEVSSIGKSIIATEDHPFLTWRKDCSFWVKAGELKPGDLVLTSPDIPTHTEVKAIDFRRNLLMTYSEKQQALSAAYNESQRLRKGGMKVWHVIKKIRAKYGRCNTNWFYGAMPRPLRELETRKTYELGWLATTLGFLYGDGSLYKDFTLTFCVSEDEAPIIIRSLQTRSIDHYSHHSRTKRSETIQVYDYTLSRLLYTMGLPLGNKQKQKISIPRLPHEDERMMRLFLSGLYGAEGSVRIRGLRAEVTISMNTENETYLHDFFAWIQTWLSSKSIKSSLAISATQWRTKSFVLSITDSHSVTRFLQLVNFAYSPIKQKRANVILSKLLVAENMQEERRHLKRTILVAHGAGQSQSSLSHNFGIPKQTVNLWVTKPSFDVAFQSNVLGQIQSPPVTHNFRWERLTSVIPVDTDEAIFDLAVRENHNFLANGFVVHNCGLDWKKYIEKGLITPPVTQVYVTVNESVKLRELKKIIENSPPRQLVYSDWLEKGASIAKELGCPFVNGETKSGLNVILSNKLTVVSKVADVGIDVTDLRTVVEIGFLFGSRRQEIQRFGRLLHSRFKGEYYILFTREEYAHYNKRLLGLYEKGFRIKVEEIAS